MTDETIDLAGETPAPSEEIASEEKPSEPKLNVPKAEGDDAGQSEAAKETPDNETKDEDQPKKDDKKRPGAKERIDELTAKWRNEERRANEAIREAKRLREKLSQRPKVADDDFEGQQRAQFREEITRDRAEDAIYQAQQAEESRIAARTEAFTVKLDAVADRFNGDLVSAFTNTPVSEYAAEVLADSDVGGELALWLASNPTEAQQIAQMPPAQQIRALSRQEARIQAAPRERKVSQAPPPPSKLSPSASPGKKDPADMSMAEYAEWYKKRSA